MPIKSSYGVPLYEKEKNNSFGSCKKKNLILQLLPALFERLIIMTKCLAEQNAKALLSLGKETKTPPSEGGT
jgi:hypothetical protein